MAQKSTYLKNILEGCAEDALPSEKIQLWPAIQSRLNASASLSQERFLSMNSTAHKPRLRVATMLFVSVLIILAALFATPQGRAMADEIFHFFKRAPSDTLPVQSWQLTPFPTLGSSTPTPDPASIIDANQTVQEVEKRAGFDVLEPAYLPKILHFSSASFDPKLRIARIFYRYVYTNGLLLRENPYQTKADCDLCYTVGASAAVETVQIGEVKGEYVEGVWYLTDKGPVWMNDPYLKTLRWQANGIAFELGYMGPPDTVTKEDMIAVAESLK
jgi:hypothetical protein